MLYLLVYKSRSFPQWSQGWGLGEFDLKRVIIFSKRLQQNTFTERKYLKQPICCHQDSADICEILHSLRTTANEVRDHVEHYLGLKSRKETKSLVYPLIHLLRHKKCKCLLWDTYLRLIGENCIRRPRELFLQKGVKTVHHNKQSFQMLMQDHQRNFLRQ